MLSIFTVEKQQVAEIIQTPKYKLDVVFFKVFSLVLKVENQ